MFIIDKDQVNQSPQGVRNSSRLFFSSAKSKAREKLRSSCLSFLGNFEFGIVFTLRSPKMITSDFSRSTVGIVSRRDEIKVWKSASGALEAQHNSVG